MKHVLSSLILIILLSSCEEVPVIIPTANTGGPTNTDTIFKTVLIEDFTGVKCANCPKASAAIKDIEALFGKDRVKTIGIHGGFLTSPLDGSPTDFTTPYSVELETFYRPPGKPSGQVNRRLFEFDGAFSTQIQESDEWPGVVEQELNRPAILTLEMSHDYNPVSRALTVTVTTKALADINEQLEISILLTQSDIEEAQKTNGSIIEDYVHEHVLLGGLTPALGQPLIGGMTQGDELTETYTGTVDPENGELWIADDMEIVVFVSSGSAESDEIYYVVSEEL